MAPASNAQGDHRTRRRLRTPSRPQEPTRHRLHPARNDHRSSQWSLDGLRAGSGLARGQKHPALARESRHDSGGRDLGRYRQAVTLQARGPAETKSTGPAPFLRIESNSRARALLTPSVVSRSSPARERVGRVDCKIGATLTLANTPETRNDSTQDLRSSHGR